jgi:hypothetical protein
MPLGNVLARQDWRVIAAQHAAQRSANRTLLQLALLAYGLLAFGLAAWRAAPAWLSFAQAALFVAAFLWLPLRVTLQRSATGARTLIVAAGVLFASVLLAALTAPVALFGLANPWRGALPPWLSALIPAGMLALLLWATRRHPGLAHQLGFAMRAWGYQAALGLFLGLVFGLHLWLVVAAVPAPVERVTPSVGTLVWLLFVSAGLISLGQELALRGVLFPMLAAEGPELRITIFLRLIALSAPLYIAPVMIAPTGAPMPIGLLYGALFTILATVLRFTERSLIAPLCANISFHVLMILATHR